MLPYFVEMTLRLAAAACLLCIIGALLATFLPTSYAGDPCGTWLSPVDRSADLERARKLYRDASELGAEGAEFRATAVRGMAAVRVTDAACTGELEGRRNLATVFGVGAVALPAVVVGVGRSQRRETVPG